jgi:hypothetical protein
MKTEVARWLVKYVLLTEARETEFGWIDLDRMNRMGEKGAFYRRKTEGAETGILHPTKVAFFNNNVATTAIHKRERGETVSIVAGC